MTSSECAAASVLRSAAGGAGEVSVVGSGAPRPTELVRNGFRPKKMPLLSAPWAYSGGVVQGPDLLDDAELADRTAYWRESLAGSPLGQMPLDHPRSAQQSFTRKGVQLTINHTTIEGLRRVAQTTGSTVFQTLAAAYAWWLHRYLDSTDVVFGAADERCASPTVLRCEVSGTESFSALVSRVRHVVAEAYRHAVPGEDLLNSIGIQSDSRDNHIFRTALVLGPRRETLAHSWSDSLNCDVTINLVEQIDGQLTGVLDFRAELFDDDTVREMAAQWNGVLDAAAVAPELPMADHDLVSPAQRRRQLEWNLAAVHDDSSQSIYEIIRAQVERTPHAVAVQLGDIALTYRQLDECASVIAAQLVLAGAGSGAVVALLLDRTTDLVAAIIGVLKTGAAFVPLDPRQPLARNAFCIHEAAANIIVTDHDLPAGEGVTATVINIAELTSRVPVGGVWSNTVAAEDLAYVVYTSGSTGRPKGVLVEHRGMVNLMHTMFPRLGITASDTVLSVSSISFDVALADFFCALACGARVVLATALQATDFAALGQLIADCGATYLMATPTTWAGLIASGWCGDSRLTAVSIGETLSPALAAGLLQRCGSVWNSYGPTEATVTTNFVRLAEKDTVTVGRPLPNLRVYVTDSRGRLQPVGVPGEIVIGGIGVARGYLNRPEEDARRFGDDPLHTGGRIFRTGDRGRFLPDGRVQHLGRYDDQLKIRGCRIEPGEIESVLREHPDVEHCAVVARPSSGGEPQLIAYLVGRKQLPRNTELRAWLSQRLPAYMVPKMFVQLSAVPLTTSGKLDKAALPAPASAMSSGGGTRSPRGDTQRLIATLWADLLAVPVTDATEDFFDMGGDSLLAVRLISEIQRVFGIQLPLAAFVDQGRTVAQLAKLLDVIRLTGGTEVIDVAPLHFIFANAASAMGVRHFARRWGAMQPVHVLTPDQPAGRFDRSVSLEQHARQALSAIRARQPDGPLLLAGYSIGGLVAYEVARQAIDAGQQIEWLGVVDEMAPPTMRRIAAQPLHSRLRRLGRQPARARWGKCADAARRVLGRGDTFDYPGAVAMACQYQQSGHDVPLHLYISADTAVDAESELLGWKEFHRGTVSGCHFSGSHVGLLETPWVGQLAQQMGESLHPVSRLRIAG